MSGARESDTERARRLASAERVASGLLHEVRNVLNPIVSAAFLLDAAAGDPAKVRDLAQRIEGFARAEDRLRAAVRTLLEREAVQGGDGPAGAPRGGVSSSTSAQNP